MIVNVLRHGTTTGGNYILGVYASPASAWSDAREHARRWGLRDLADDGTGDLREGGGKGAYYYRVTPCTVRD